MFGAMFFREKNLKAKALDLALVFSGCSSFTSARSKEVADPVEVLFHDKTDALGVHARLGEVAVVGLVVHLEGEIAVGVKQILHIEVADERRGGLRGVVAIAELSVEQEPVVEHAAVDDALVLGVVPAFVAGGDIGAEIPVLILDQCAEQGVDLCGECA